MSQLQGRAPLVTGAARGIGAAVVREVARGAPPWVVLPHRWSATTPIRPTLDSSPRPGQIEEVVMSEKIATRTGVTRGFVALLLLTAGVLVLVGPAVPVVGDCVALVLGIELLAAWPLQDAEANVVGGAFLVSLAVGFLLVAVLGQWWQRRQTWAWISAPVAGAVGGALMAGAEVLGQLIESPRCWPPAPWWRTGGCVRGRRDRHRWSGLRREKRSIARPPARTAERARPPAPRKLRSRRRCSSGPGPAEAGPTGRPVAELLRSPGSTCRR